MSTEVTLIHGDSLESMRNMPDRSIDLILTDPPYGIDACEGVGGFGSSKTDKHYRGGWDSSRPDKEYFNEIIRVSKNAVIFGGNFFTDLLPVNGHWICWDKTGGINFQNPFSDCELAWTNIDKKTVKKYVIIQQGFISKEKERFHPTQKPIELMGRIIVDYTKNGDTILDPFMGSGTTGIACKTLGRDFIGIELDETYFNIAQERINNTQVPII